MQKNLLARYAEHVQTNIGVEKVEFFFNYLKIKKRCELGRQKMETSTPTIFSFLQMLMRFILYFGTNVYYYHDYLNCVDDDDANDDSGDDVVDYDDNENDDEGSCCC